MVEHLKVCGDAFSSDTLVKLFCLVKWEKLKILVSIALEHRYSRRIYPKRNKGLASPTPGEW